MLVSEQQTTQDDKNLLTRLQHGEKQAVLDVYEQYFPQLHPFVLLKVSEPSLAEDIVSDVFVRLLEAVGTDKAPRTHLRGWLFQVARHEIAAQGRQKQTMPLGDLEDIMPAPDANPEAQIMGVFDVQRVQNAMRMLTPDHQEVLLLRFGQRLSLKETAQLMGKKLGAVKSLQFRAVATLRQILIEE
jgi:RNA polymerase sigma-70 factor (ECF subfamily)